MRIFAFLFCLLIFPTICYGKMIDVTDIISKKVICINTENISFINKKDQVKVGFDYDTLSMNYEKTGIFIVNIKFLNNKELMVYMDKNEYNRFLENLSNK